MFPEVYSLLLLSAWRRELQLWRSLIWLELLSGGLKKGGFIKIKIMNYKLKGCFSSLGAEYTIQSSMARSLSVIYSENDLSMVKYEIFKQIWIIVWSLKHKWDIELVNRVIYQIIIKFDVNPKHLRGQKIALVWNMISFNEAAFQASQINVSIRA